MRRIRSDIPTVDAFEEGVQLPLEIDGHPVKIPKRRIRTSQRNPSVAKSPQAEPVLWMRDLCDLYGIHRCTLHRWMRAGAFPKKDAPADHPRGWKLSTIVKWQRNTAMTSASQPVRSGNASL